MKSVLDCELGGRPETCSSSLVSEGGASCPTCEDLVDNGLTDLDGLVGRLAGRTVFVDPALDALSSAAASSSGDLTLPFSLARSVLGLTVTLPGTTFVFRSSGTYGPAVHGYQLDSCGGTDWLGTVADPFYASAYADDVEERNAYLVVRARGTASAPLVLTSDGDPETGLARFDGGYRWTRADPGDDTDCSPCRRGNSPFRCEDEQPLLEGTTGILLLDTCHAVVSDLEVSGFGDGIRVEGDTHETTLQQLEVHHNIVRGVHLRCCRELRRASRERDDEHAESAPHLCPVLPDGTVGYPYDNTVTRCLLHDNGAGLTSANGNIVLGFYATSTSIHHNLLYCEPFGSAWDTFPPARTLQLIAESDAGCGAEDEEGEEDAGAQPTGCDGDLVGIGRKSALTATYTCGGNEEPPAHPAQDKAQHGFSPSPVEDCLLRPGCDGIATERASSGHRIEHNVFLGNQKNCGAWQIPGLCCDTSDGDGIDFKSLRNRTERSSATTIVASNLFLFNEGAAIQAMNGTQGLEIYRNVMIGNGTGIFIKANQVQFYDEWTVADGDRDWIEVGCFSIYRNLILANDRIDRTCDGEASSGGHGINIDVNGPPLMSGTTQTFDFRFRDIRIVNNTIHGNPGLGIRVARRGVEADGSGPQTRVLDLVILNNAVTENGYRINPEHSVQTRIQAAFDVISTEGAHLEWEPEELQSWTVDHNFWHRGDGYQQGPHPDVPAGAMGPASGVESPVWRMSIDREVYRFGLAVVQSLEDRLGVSALFEGAWTSGTVTDHYLQDPMYTAGRSSLFSAGPSVSKAFSKGTWDWTAWAYAFAPDWGVVAPEWDVLPLRLSPEYYRPLAASPLVAWRASTTGVADREATEALSSTAPVAWVDVARGPGLLESASGLQAIGALEALQP